MNLTLMTQADFASHRGVRPSAVSNWKSRGLLVFAEDPAQPGKHLVNVAATEARLSSKVDPTRGRPRSSPSSASSPAAPTLPLSSAPDRQLAEVRLDLLEEQRIGQRLKNATAVRDLVARVEMERRAGELGRVVFSRLSAMHRSLSERLAAETDQRSIVALLEDATDRLRHELADMIAAGTLADQPEGGDPLDAAEEG